MLNKSDLTINYVENLIIDFPRYLPFQNKRQAVHLMMRLYKILSHYEELYAIEPFILEDTPQNLKSQDKYIIQDWCVYAVGALAKAGAQGGLSTKIVPILFHLVELHTTKMHIVAYLYRCVAELSIANGKTKLAIDYGIIAFSLYKKMEKGQHTGTCAYIVATAYRSAFYLGNRTAISDASQWIEISASEYAKTTSTRQYV